MEIRQLEAFAAVHSSGSVTAAARLLDRSQPMVSRQIQDLEQELGFTLFTRTRPQVTLTEQGKQFYDEVHHVLAGLQQLDSRSRQIAQGHIRPLRIASTHSLACTLLPGVVGDLERTCPIFTNKMSIESMMPADVVQVVSDGEADIGVLSIPIELGRCQLQWSGQAPYLMALPVGHPLADEETVRLEDLGDTAVITMSNRSRLRHRLSTALLPSDPDAEPRRHVETTSSVNALMLVRAGVGVSLVDPITAATMYTPEVVFRPLDRYFPYMVGAITQRERALSDEGKRLLQAMWDYAVRLVPRLVPGDPSGLPVEADPFQASDASSGVSGDNY